MLLDTSLWPNVERRLSDEFGAPLRPLDQLGRARENRITWAADADGIGEVIVKARFRDRAGAKTRWCARNLPLLAARGYPVPEYLWFGPLDRDWYVVVQRRLLGHRIQKPDEQLLGELLSLVELQADAGIESGPRDMAGYHALILFEGWDHFRGDAEAPSAEAQRGAGEHTERAATMRAPRSSSPPTAVAPHQEPQGDDEDGGEDRHADDRSGPRRLHG